MIYLLMTGVPSRLELFDYQPELSRCDGKLPPPELIKHYRAALINPHSTLLGARFKSSRHGQCGAELSEKSHLAGNSVELTSPRPWGLAE